MVGKGCGVGKLRLEADIRRETRDEWEQAHNEEDGPQAYSMYVRRLEQYYLRRAGYTYATWQRGFTGRDAVQPPRRTRRAAPEAAGGEGASFAWEAKAGRVWNKVKELIRERKRAARHGFGQISEREKRTWENAKRLGRKLDGKWGSQRLEHYWTQVDVPALDDLHTMEKQLAKGRTNAIGGRRRESNP